MRIRPGLAKARNRSIDQTGLILPQFRPQPQPAGNTGAKVFHHHIALQSNGARSGLGIGILQIQHDRLFTPVHQREQRGLTLHKRADVAVIIALRRFKFDHLCPKISQHSGAKRPRHHARQIKDFQPFQHHSAGICSAVASVSAPDATKRAAAARSGAM